MPPIHRRQALARLGVAALAPGALAPGQGIAPETGCANCHVEDGKTPDGEQHDVKSRISGDVKSKFDTPTLDFVAGTAPYFHDGRYATLRQLLVKSDGKMGHTKQLSPEDLDALEAFLRSR